MPASCSGPCGGAEGRKEEEEEEEVLKREERKMENDAPCESYISHNALSGWFASLYLTGADSPGEPDPLPHTAGPAATGATISVHHQNRHKDSQSGAGCSDSD